MNGAVRLIAKTDGVTTGLSRYADQLYRHLLLQGVKTELAGVRMPSILKPVAPIAQAAGYDLSAFSATYPLSLPLGATECITHLTSQNQASAIAFRAPAKTVVTVHDLITAAYRCDPEITGYMTVYDRLFDSLALRGLRRADAIIADSQSTRDDILRLLDYPANRIHVVYLGIDPQCFYRRPVPSVFFSRYQLEGSRPYVLYVGSEDPRKNLRRLVAAFAQVKAQHPELMLIKVGAARFQQQRQELLAYIQARGLAGGVRFIDQVSDSDLVHFYSIADLLVFPSLYEGFGLPVLEAMACGAPVVTSNVSSLPEVAGDAALLVNPLDVDAIAAAMERVLAETGLAADLRARGLARAAHFSWERTVQETLAVYERVLSGG